jgi:hypothetical protein
MKKPNRFFNMFKTYVRSHFLFNTEGSALMSVILAIAILSFVGMALLTTTYNNQTNAKALRNYETAYYKSEQALHLGTEALLKAGSMEVSGMLNPEGVDFDEAFLLRVIDTAQTLLPSDLWASQSGQEGLFMEVIDSQKGTIRLTAAGKVDDMIRYTRRDLILDLPETGSGSGGTFPYYSDYSTIIGGNIRFPLQHPATTRIVFDPQGVLGGNVEFDKVTISNYATVFPSGFTWLDSIGESLEELFSTQDPGSIIVEGDIISIHAGTAAFPQETVHVTMSGRSIRVGTKLFNSLSDKVLLVQGNIVFEPELLYTNGKFDQMMVLATGDITINTAEERNNDIEDAMYLFSGKSVFFTEKKGGGTHHLSFYADQFHYYAMKPGAVKTTFIGQQLVKNSFDISKQTGSFRMNTIYDSTQTQRWYDILNELSRQGLISTGSSDIEIGSGSIFTRGRMVEISIP